MMAQGQLFYEFGLGDGLRERSSGAEDPRHPCAGFAANLQSSMGRPERLLPLSWEQPTAICTPQSVHILASPVGLPLTFPLRLSPCGKVRGPTIG
jgi:hypothetical protein